MRLNPKASFKWAIFISVPAFKKKEIEMCIYEDYKHPGLFLLSGFLECTENDVRDLSSVGLFEQTWRSPLEGGFSSLSCRMREMGLTQSM